MAQSARPRAWAGPWGRMSLEFQSVSPLLAAKIVGVALTAIEIANKFAPTGADDTPYVDVDIMHCHILKVD